MTASVTLSIRSLAVILWGVLGVVLTLVEAIWRLALIALETLQTHALTTVEIALLAAWTVLIWYAEAYRGFQKRFSPRVVARALHLARHPRPLHVVFAPIYCMGLLHATRRRLIATWLLVVGIVTLVLLVRRLPPIYRAIVDFGVALALTWGTVVMLVYLVRGLAGRPMPVPPDVPEPSGPGPAGVESAGVEPARRA